MLLPFIFVVGFAIILDLYISWIIEDDLNDKSLRPIILLIVAGTAWFISMGLLTIPDTTTTFYGPYNVLAGNQLIQYGPYNTTQQTNTPFPAWGFYEYSTFAVAMVLVNAVALWFYMTKTASDDVLNEVVRKKGK